jgi:hypothetical protein
LTSTVQGKERSVNFSITFATLGVSIGFMRYAVMPASNAFDVGLTMVAILLLQTLQRCEAGEAAEPSI